MKLTLTINADDAADLRTQLRGLLGEVTSTGELLAKTAILDAVDVPFNEGGPVTGDDPRDVYGPGNGPLPDVTECDSAGVEYDESLHASPAKKNKDGTWRKRRGAPVEAAPVEAAPVEAAPVPEWTPQAVMQKLSDSIANGDKSLDYARQLTTDFEMESLADISSDPKLFDAVVEKLKSDGVL